MKPTIDELIEKTLTFLRTFGVLEGKPVFHKIGQRLECIDPRGEWEEYFMQPPYWQPVEYDVHEAQFASIDMLLERTSYNKVQDRAVEDIPDSEHTVIVEIGSGYGQMGAGYLASKKPNAKVVLVSKEEPDPDVFPKYLFMKSKTPFKEFVFHTGTHIIVSEKNKENRVNQLYRANGINNVTYYTHELVLEDPSDELPDFLADCKSKEVYVFGHKSPTHLPFVIGNLYQALEAKEMVVSPTALSRSSAESFMWNAVQRNLGLSDEELSGLVLSTIDDGKNEKYDYDNKGKNVGQRRIGVMIKLGVYLALAKSVGGEILRNTHINVNGWNQADHYVRARRAV